MDTMNALAPPLARMAPYMVPGSQSFGYFVYTWAMAAMVLTLVTVPLGHRMFRWAVAVVALGSTTLPVLTLLELFGQPSVGRAAEPLTFSWGAVVAVGAGLVAGSAAWSAVFFNTYQPHEGPTVGDRTWTRWLNVVIHRTVSGGGQMTDG